MSFHLMTKHLLMQSLKVQLHLPFIPVLSLIDFRDRVRRGGVGVAVASPNLRSRGIAHDDPTLEPESDMAIGFRSV
jgi:hypothetical protein